MIGFKTWDEVLEHVRAANPIWYQSHKDLNPKEVSAQIIFKYQIKVSLTHNPMHTFQCNKDHLDRFRKRDLVFEGILIDPKPFSPKPPYKQSGEYYMVGQSQSSAAWAHKPNCSTYGMSWQYVVAELAQGGYVVDKRHLSSEVASEIYASPIDAPLLSPMTLRDIYQPEQTFTSFEEFWAFYRGRTILNQASGISGAGLSMAHISLDLYAEFWRSLGARIGRKINGNIYWKENS